MDDMGREVTLHDDYSGSGRVTQVFRGGVLAWTWAWHIDGPPSDDAMSLLRALGMHDA